MRARILTEPVTHEEARRFIRDKPVVSRQVFDRLLPEIRVRAFTITGVRNADTMQRVRDRIADLPAGADWAAVKRDVIREVLPDFIDPDASPEERDKQIAASARRAELLLRTHGFQAYQAAAWHRHEALKDVFPYRRYLTVGDRRVRDSHRALHRMVLPVDDPFWDDHYPPWDYGCRCQAVPVSRAAYEAEVAKDAHRAPENRLVPSETIRNDMRATGRLMRGHQVYDVTPTSAKTGHGWKWHPRDMRIPLDALKDRYDAQTWDVFERTARSAQIKDSGTGSTRSLWDWLGGKDAPGAMAAATLVQTPKTPDELLTRRVHTSDDAARVLKDHPNYEESVIMRRWARDREGQRDIAWGNSPQQQHQRAVFSSIIDRIEPYRSEEPVYRGFKSRINPKTGEDILAKIMESGGYQNASPGMSASKAAEVAHRNKFLGRDGFVMEIQGHKSARDFEPLSHALHPGHEDEKEVVFPYGRFRLLGRYEIEVQRGNQRWMAPVVIVEEAI